MIKMQVARFYSHVNYSVTKIKIWRFLIQNEFYSHVNYSVTKISTLLNSSAPLFYSHVNYSVTKIDCRVLQRGICFTVT